MMINIIQTLRASTPVEGEIRLTWYFREIMDLPHPWCLGTQSLIDRIELEQFYHIL